MSSSTPMLMELYRQTAHGEIMNSTVIFAIIPQRSVSQRSASQYAPLQEDAPVCGALVYHVPKQSRFRHHKYRSKIPYNTINEQNENCLQVCQALLNNLNKLLNSVVKGMNEIHNGKE